MSHCVSPPNGIGLSLRWELIPEILQSRERLNAVSFFEVSPENYMARGGYLPAALHRVREMYSLRSHGLSLSLGGARAMDRALVRQVRRFLDEFGIEVHSDHLAACGPEGMFFHDLFPVPFTSRHAQRIASNVQLCAELLERPMAVENISYYLDYGFSWIDEVHFLTEVLERANCGLLLDLNNLDVNARNLQFDPWDWLSHVPLSRVVELHVAGPELHHTGVIVDTHGSAVAPRVYELLAWVLERTGPLPVVLERENALPTLDELLSEVQTLDAAYHSALSRRAAPFQTAATLPTTVQAAGYT